MIIVENSQSFQKLIDNIKKYDFIFVPVLSDHKNHPAINDISLLYFYFIITDEEFLLSFNHQDCLIIDNFESIKEHIISSEIKKFVYDKRDMQHLFKSILDENWIDVSILEYIKTGEIKTNFQEFTPAHDFTYRKFENTKNLNLYIPATKHIEYLSDVRNKIIKIMKKCIDILDDSSFTNFNNLFQNNFYSIESSGIFVNDDFKRKDLTRNNIAYLKYKINTVTSRPSCSVNGYNFMAINKDDGSRNQFVSRFKDGYMLLIDYNAYHFYLIADIIGEKLQIHPYNFIGKMMFNKNELSEEEYNQAKQLSFTIIYGGIPTSIKNVPFFAKIQEKTDELFAFYRKNGYIVTKLFKRKIYIKDKDMNPGKLFNYYLQSYETENNMIILNKINQYSNQYNSKIVMYIFDSVLIDFDINDGSEYVNRIILDMEQNGKFPVSIKYGKNYHKMKNFERNLYL